MSKVRREDRLCHFEPFGKTQDKLLLTRRHWPLLSKYHPATHALIGEFNSLEKAYFVLQWMTEHLA
jgi:hypothetical protein